MADYFTQFSCTFDLGDPSHVALALALYTRMTTELEAQDISMGFDAETDRTSLSKLWLHDDGGAGEPEHVISFVLRCAETFDLTGLWGFRWALSCSRPLEDGFGGGAQVLDLGKRQSRAWIDCHEWLELQLRAVEAAQKG